ncbi:unnamed protein product [Rotaria sp. Silwood2]|nr:unnamed protein product [Rotaria sp. Silwood2]CAF3401856.1 unnamed protein product [Rotaria sp. Silwood2]
MKVPEQTAEIDDHRLNLADLYQRYNTDRDTGLTDAQVKELLIRDGPNILSQPKPISKSVKLYRHLFGGFSLVFWICVIIYFIMYGFSTATHDENASISYLWLGIMLIIEELAIVFFSYYQESKSSSTMASITKMASQQILVIRNGEKNQINTEDLVVGDIIEVKSGDSIPDWRNQFNNAYLELGKLGERALGFCELQLSSSEYPYGYSFNINEYNFPVNNLRFLGLMAMINPPKVAVPNTIMNCRSAGIKVIMFTGDHPCTAKGTARATNIISEGSETIEDIAERLGTSPESVNPNDAKACVIHGNDLGGPAEIDELLRDYTEIVFARTDPKQKACIVEACQRQGAIVTMIGNSISDSPALQQADVRIAMAYGLIGLLQVAAGFLAYFLAITENGFLPSHLFDLRKLSESEDVNNLRNSYDQEWVRSSSFIYLKQNLFFFKTDEQRKQLNLTCYTAFFMTVSICQLATLIVFKTRRNSIMQQGMK